MSALANIPTPLLIVGAISFLVVVAGMTVWHLVRTKIENESE